jgi:hypothetical protein
VNDYAAEIAAEEREQEHRWEIEALHDYIAMVERDRDELRRRHDLLAAAARAVIANAEPWSHDGRYVVGGAHIARLEAAVAPDPPGVLSDHPT